MLLEPQCTQDAMRCGDSQLVPPTEEDRQTDTGGYSFTFQQAKGADGEAWLGNARGLTRSRRPLGAEHERSVSPTTEEGGEMEALD